MDPYLRLWAQSERTSRGATTPSGAPRLDWDVNLPVKKSWHFGPPPGGWSANSDIDGYMGLGRLGTEPSAYATGAIDYDPSRQISDTDRNYVIVTTRWAQRAVNGRQLARLVVDGQAGPATMRALEEARHRTAATRPPLQVPSRTERPMASSGPWASHVALDLRTEDWLRRAPRVADPRPAGTVDDEGSSITVETPPATSPETVSSGAGAALPILAIGAGLVWMFVRSRR